MKVIDIRCGDASAELKKLSDCSVQCCVTSPPYWGLRDYGVDGQLGLEPTPDEYVAKMVAVFREVWRVLRDDGTLWLNLGSSYACSPAGNFGENMPAPADGGRYRENKPKMDWGRFKPKDLVPIPWMVAMALQADGWYLRSDIIWHKPNPMPESVTDRPTKSHEYLFLLTKNQRYYYDAEAIKEPSVDPEGSEKRYESNFGGIKAETLKATGFGNTKVCGPREFNGTRNKRTVWTVPTSPYSEAHFATFPPDLIKPCIMAGTKPGDTVLDPFGGSGTTGMVALELGRKAILIELNPEYIELINRRTFVTQGLSL